MPKDKRNKADLELIIMDSIRKTAGCRDIEKVVITPTADPAGPNWQASFVISGAKATPSAAFQIMRSLQAKYECAF